MGEKLLSYEQAKTDVALLTDKLGMPIDANIQELVISFWMHNIKTEASCEGHLDHGVPYPWIDIAPQSNFQALHVIMSSNLREMPTGEENKNVWVFHPYGQGKRLRLTPWNIHRSLKEMHTDAAELALFLRKAAL
jgi:hypothetical protein